MSGVVTWTNRIAFMVALMVSLVEGASATDKYPNRPITVTVGFAAGSVTDGIVRVANENVSAELGQPMIVENRPGAGSSVQISHLAAKEPDGYTLGALLVGAVVSQHLRKVSYDAVRDLTPIIMLGSLPQGLVVKADAPWKTMQEFIDHAKARPQSIRYATAGVGTAQHLAMEALGLKLGVKWIHVPYKSGMQAVTAAVSGEVDAAAQTAEWTPFVKDGRLRLLSVFTPKRFDDFPETPTLRELGFDITAPSMIGIVGPRGMNPEIVTRLHDAYRKAMSEPRFLTTMRNYAVRLEYLNSVEFGSYIKDTSAFYGETIRRAGLAETN